MAADVVAGQIEKTALVNPQALVARERDALAAHKAALRGGDLPSPESASRGTFAHGLLLPLSLFVATMRQPALRGPFLRLAAVRAAVLVVVGSLLVVAQSHADKPARPAVMISDHDEPDDDDDDVDTAPAKAAHDKDEPVNVDLPGLRVHVDKTKGPPDVEILGKKVPVVPSPSVAPSAAAPPPPAAPTPTFVSRTRAALAHEWARIVAIVGTLSIVERILVFLSRAWDDWLSFYISSLARIRPESVTPPQRKLSMAPRSIWRRLWRRARGAIVFASGLPLLYLLKLVPLVGSWLFAAGVTMWAWYWGGVFSAAKSAHAWADDGIAGPPRIVQSLSATAARHWWLWPLRVYGRLWAWVVRGVNAAAATFERSPAPFLGLALARGVLALPGLYLLMRPIIPVAAGRLCAEVDPERRFSA